MLGFIAVLAVGTGASADPVTETLCNPPDLGAVTSLLRPVTDVVADSIVCEESTSVMLPPVSKPKPAVKKPNTRPAARTQPSVVRPASPLVLAPPAPVKIGTASGAPARPNPEIVSVPVPIAVARAARFPIVFGVGLAAGVFWMTVLIRRRARRADAVERMKTELLSNISHELRTPLTPVRGYAEMLRNRKLPPEKVQQFAEAILDAAEQLESVVNILVSFAAMEGGRVDVRRKPVELQPILGELAERWQRRAPNHLVTAHAEDVPAVLLDPRLIKLAVDQLLDNAVKFSPEGGVVTACATVSGHTLEISVDDQGEGIEPRTLETIFESFRQGDGSSTRKFGGLGLGLSLVARVAEIHDGEVRVASKPGQGSTFTLALPLHAVTDRRVVKPSEAVTDEPVRTGSPAEVQTIDLDVPDDLYV